MDINIYMRREFLRERAELNVEIDRRIDKGLTKSKDYKHLLSEHRKVSALLRPMLCKKS